MPKYICTLFSKVTFLVTLTILCSPKGEALPIRTAPCGANHFKTTVGI